MKYLFLLLVSFVNVTGAIAQESGQEIVKLPPLVVSELPEGLPWRFGRVAGVEVLSLANDYLTADFVAAHLRSRRFVPGALLAERTAPASFILFENKSALVPAVRTHSSNARWREGTIMYPGQVVQSAGDALYAAVNLWGTDRWPMADSAFLREVVVNAPALPDWIRAGLFGSSGVFAELCVHHERPVIDLPSFLWVSEEVSAELRQKRFRAPELLPMTKLFASPPDGQKEPEALKVWSSQVGLFARWQLFGNNGRPIDAEAFWGFALEACTRPVDETMFRHWLKLSYADAEKEMRGYLRVAIAAPEMIRIDEVNRPLAELSELHLRMATEEEVARLKGNFERMEARRLRCDFPELADKYAAAARRTFKRGLKANPASGVLRGLLGELEHDLGHADAARPLLEFAFAHDALSTRGLLDLARLRLADMRIGLPPDGKLPVEALDRVLTPLFAARARKPPVPEVYQMIADVWAQSAVAPTKRHLAVLLEGAQFFRDDTDYIVAVIELHRRHGYTAEADALLVLGETWARSDAARAYYTKLRTTNAPDRKASVKSMPPPRILTTRRTLLQILYQDASEWLDPQTAPPRT
ncbi:MAG: hypothetical protein HYV95_16045 [Opitutae bacterium]|nr:hypothetical protein [Opitutae bacterium]